MVMRCLMFFVLLVTAPAYAAQTIDVPPRSDDHLIVALCKSASERTVIELARNSHYELALRTYWSWRPDSPHDPESAKFLIFPPTCGSEGWHLQISSHVTVRGNGSVLDFENGFGFFVEEGATLILEDVELTGAAVFGALYNFGSVVLRRVTIRENEVTRYVDGAIDPELSFDLPVNAAAITNYGELDAANVYIADNTARWTAPPYACPAGTTPGIFNAGEVRLNNVTFDDNHVFRLPDEGEACPYAIYNDDAMQPDARVNIANTFFESNFGRRACWGEVTSLGYNLEPRGDSCGLSPGAGDNNSPFGIFPPSERTNTGGITYPVIGDTFLETKHVIDQGSPNTSGDNVCEPDDIRGFLRNTTETGRCDIGAVEQLASGMAGDLAGTWLNPASDGHYLTVTQLEGQNVLVIWSSFDTAGEQLWLYGVGPRDGSQLSVDAYRNVGGLVAQGELEPAEQELWGQLSFRTDSCTTGVLELEPAAPGSSISTELTRIAESAELNCLGPE